MPEFLELTLQAVIGGAIALGGVLLLPFTSFGERWLGHLFDRRLAELTHDQNTKIEALRSKLNLLSDRGIRSNEKEYGALIEAWVKYAEAHLATKRCIVRLIDYPADFAGMTDDEVKKALAITELSDRQKDEVLKASDRKAAFERAHEARGITRAGQAIYEAHEALRQKGIFIPDDLEQKFLNALQIVGGAQIQQYMEYGQRGSTREIKATSDFLEKDQTMFADLKAAVRSRLHINPT